MIDLHCHCLPGLDDGPESWEYAEALCRAAAEDGCEQIIATPHQRLGEWWNCDPQGLRELQTELQSRVEGLLTVHLGAEVRVDLALLDDLEAPDRSGILSLAASDFILIEFSRLGPSGDPEDLVHELGLRGLRPILAHPEFIPGLGDNLELLSRLRKMGALVQVTAMSLLGNFGRRSRLLVDRMLDEDLVDFVASDAHDTRHRPPGLSAAASKIAERWGPDAAHRLTHENALQVLNNSPALQPIETLAKTSSSLP